MCSSDLLAPNVVEVLDDVANKPESRAAMKRKAQVAAYEKRKKKIIVKHGEGDAQPLSADKPLKDQN